jgi:prolyl-tRNA synthetase
VPWDVVRDAETDLAADALTVRCLQRADGSVPGSSAEPDLTATVAKAY